jgi:rod shape determining protein RodA
MKIRDADTFDSGTLLIALAIGAFGVLTIWGATDGVPGLSGVHRTQMIWLALGLVVFGVAAAVDYHLWADVAPVLYAGSLVLLGVLLVVARTIANTRSWFEVGPVRFQPSEAAKVAVILMLAWYLARRGGGKLGATGVLAVAAIIGAPVALIALQPDMGTCLTYAPLLAASVFLGGMRWRTILVIVLMVALLAPIVWSFGLKGYQRERILTVFQPERDPSGTGYQVRQSRIAIGSGGVFGKGLLSGTQSRLQFLPQHHTDFVLSALAEQWGFIGAMTVVGLYVALVLRAFSTARLARDRLGLYIATGVGTLLGFQALINMGMVLGALPTIGVPLPLLSYGGSSMLATMTALGLLANVRSRRFVN